MRIYSISKAICKPWRAVRTSAISTHILSWDGQIAETITCPLSLLAITDPDPVFTSAKAATVLVFNTFCCGRIHVWGLEFVVDVLSLQDLELISIWYSCNNSQCGHSCHTWPRILLIWGFGSFGQFQINISLPKRYYLELKKKKH